MDASVQYSASDVSVPTELKRIGIPAQDLWLDLGKLSMLSMLPIKTIRHLISSGRLEAHRVNQRVIRVSYGAWKRYEAESAAHCGANKT